MADTEIGALKISLSLQEADFSRSMSEITRKMRGINNEFKVASAGVAGYDRSLAGMQANSRRLTSVLDLQRTRLSRLKAEYDRLNNAEKIDQAAIDKVANRYNKTAASVRTMESELSALNRKIAEQSTVFGRLAAHSQDYIDRGRKVSAVGSSMMTSFGIATAAMGGSMIYAAKQAGTFEHQMADIRKELNTGGISATKLDSIMSQVSNNSLKWSQQYGASTDVINEGILELVKNGYSVQESQAIMHGSLQASIGANEGLEQVVNASTSALETYGLKTKDAAKNIQNASKVQDIFAAVANATKASFTGLGSAFSIVGATAHSLGQPLTVTAAAIGELNSNGVDASSAANALKAGMVNLVRPTKQMSEAMKRMGLDVFDAHGQMKPLPDILDQIEKGTEGWTSKQKAQALAMVFGKESLASWNILVNHGSKELRDLAKEGEDSTGSVKKLADQMKNTPENKLKQLQASAHALAVEFGEKVLPAFMPVVDEAKDLVQWFGKLDPATQQNIAKMAIMATATMGAGAALGGVLKVTGNVTSGFGYLLSGTDKVVRAFKDVKAARAAESIADIGAGAAGATGKLGTLTKSTGLLTTVIGGLTSPVGLVTLGLGAAGVAAYGLYHHFNKIESTSTAAADAIGKQRAQITPMIDQYDDLKTKSTLTADEFGRFVDIQARLKKATSADEIKRLKDEADKLQNKSGLSNKQLSEMVDLNGKLVKSVPGATDKITDQGNRIADNTKKAKAYNGALLEQQLRELEIKKNAAEGNEAKYKKQIRDLQSQLNVGLAHENDLSKIANYLDEHGVEATKRQFHNHRDINQLLANGGSSLKSQLSTMQSQNDQMKDQIKKDTEHLSKADEIRKKYADTLLKSVGITAEGRKGMSILGQQVEKERDKLSSLDKQRAAGKLNTSEYEKQRSAIQKNIEKLEGVNSKIKKNTDGAFDMNKELSKDIKKDVNAKTKVDGQYRALNDVAHKQVKAYTKVDKDYYNLKNPISKIVNVKLRMPAHSQINMYNALMSRHAAGVKNLPHDEIALVGEAGREFVHDKKAGTYLVDKPTIVPLSAGSSVLKNADTERLGKSLGLPGFASGVGDAFDSLMNRYVPDVSQTAVAERAPSVTVNSDNSALVSAMHQQMAMQQQQIDLLTKILFKDNRPVITDQQIARANDHVQTREYPLFTYQAGGQ